MWRNTRRKWPSGSQERELEKFLPPQPYQGLGARLLAWTMRPGGSVEEAAISVLVGWLSQP